jgi:phosphatidylserine decarboxylase
MDILRFLAPPLHREGWRFFAAFVVLTIIAHEIWSPLGWVGIILTIWCYYFFRDPERLTPTRAGLVISPADGVVCQIIDAAPPAELGMGDAPLTRVAIFMNVFNCHVNRTPIDGSVIKMAYRPGKFLNASLDKASVDNERQAYRIANADGREIAVVQIAGLVARRIVAEVREGQPLQAGERIGMIRFGSRVDVYLPDGVAPLVSVGQTMVAGETVLADFAGSEPARDAAIR